MKTEARKAYEKNAPKWESLLRDRLLLEHSYLKALKEQLILTLNSLSDNNELSDSQKNIYKENAKFLREVIKAQKHIIQVLKSGLPQRRPEGVMAKCPFCGAKASDVVFTMTSSDGEVMEFNALEALEDVHENKFIVGCRMCGAHIEQEIDNERTVQDVINEWNRSTR